MKKVLFFNPKNKKLNIDHLLIALYFSVYFIIGISLLIIQPFGNPPDEFNRYLIPSYICEHGTLPNGYEESIRIPGYGFSYGFQPILPYMVQGYAMRLTNCFTDSDIALLYTARTVNLLFGFITAFFVLRLAKKWFPDSRMQYLFAYLVTFLPTSIFLHTYVNTDSCCMMSIAIMLYGLTKGICENFSVSACVYLSVGIILCALSYYNAYGFILSSILLFFAYYLYSKKTGEKSHITLAWKPLLKKGSFISAMVLLGIGWWFIRSYILYDGDFLGLKTRDYCASLYALPDFHPETRVTYKNQGLSMWDMLVTSDFINVSILSFIGILGPMVIISSIWVYRFYKLLFFIGFLACAILRIKKKNYGFPDALREKRPLFSHFFHCNMIFCIIMPCLLSMYYSYGTDYQPQGRYLMPALIPVCYYCVRGIQKVFTLIMDWVQQKKPGQSDRTNRCLTGLSLLCGVLILCCIFVTVYGYVFPYYAANPM